VQFSVLFNDVSYDIFVKKRPHLDRFLAWASARFEITIFTASQQIYAEQLLRYIDPQGTMIHHKLYRDSCLLVQDNYLKDLNVLGRDLARTVLVDNSPHAFGYQVDNGVPIESWFDEKSDTELLKLMKFLAEIEHSPDVRHQVRQKFQMHKLVSEAGHTHKR
jgi:CTD small phosphatase-like protein 2